MRTVLDVAGMTSRYAIRAVETALGGLPGVTGMNVTLGQVTVDHDDTVTVEMLREAISVAGFEVTATRAERGLRILG